MDGISKSFDRVICDGSHCGSNGKGQGLTKAKMDLASRDTVHSSMYSDLVSKGGGEVRLFVETGSLAQLWLAWNTVEVA